MSHRYAPSTMLNFVEPLRTGPWLLASLAAVLALTLLPTPPDSPLEEEILEIAEALPADTLLDLEPAACQTLAVLSQQAAGLTGSLALVAAEARPTQAARVAVMIHDLAVQAVAIEGGGSLARILDGLGDALEAYAGGDPAALAAIREASAANAQLRGWYTGGWCQRGESQDQLLSYQLPTGGDK